MVKKLRKRFKMFKNYIKTHKLMMTVLVGFILLGILGVDKTYQESREPVKVTYQEYRDDLESGRIDTVYYDASVDYMRYTLYNEYTTGKTEDELRDEKYEYPDEDWRMTVYPSGENFRREILENGAKVIAKSFDSGISVLITTIFSFAVMLIPFLIIFKIFFSTGKIEGTEEDVISDVRFTDVIGQEEILEDLEFIVKLMKGKHNNTMGANIPKGALLCGSPGTGKTLIAKAIAGEANVPFLYMNASSFIEMYVGVGAKRVRELFKTARKLAPCVVFIDEIDAVGCKRGAAVTSSTEDRQTLNALLQELDGFNASSGIFVLAATNTADALDEALVRSGRFDRKIMINPPRDWKVRKEMFEHYLKGCKVSAELDTIAKQCTGFTGADINAVVNEAKIIATMKNSGEITTDNIEEAIDKKIFNGNRSKKDKQDKARLVTAFHEAGHAVMTYLQKKPIARATIVSTTSGVGGFVMQTDDEQQFTTKSDIESQILICYAGRSSEEIKFGEVTTGAISDITQASRLIKQYVERFGFHSELGLLDMAVITNSTGLQHDRVLDFEIALAKHFKTEVDDLLRKNYDLVEKLANELLSRETLSGDAIEELFSGVCE